MLNLLNTELVNVKAEGLYPKGYRLQVTDFGTIENTPFMKDLHLKIGARVMLTFNVSRSFSPNITDAIS